MTKAQSLFASIALGVTSAIAVVSAVSCTKSEAKTAAIVGVRVADDVCQLEAQDAAAPEWVTLACASEGVVSHVLMPKTAWYAVRAATMKDAGPGK